MKTVITTTILLLVTLAGSRTTQAQEMKLQTARSMDWTYASLQATATSVPLRLGSGPDPPVVNTRPLTRGASCPGALG